MYEYAVVSVGDVRALRRRRPDGVVEIGETTEETVAAALTEYSSQGWKLHSIVAGDRNALLIFERISAETAKRLAEALK